MNKLINYTQRTTKEDWGQLLPLVSFCSYITAALLSHHGCLALSSPCPTPTRWCDSGSLALWRGLPSLLKCRAHFGSQVRKAKQGTETARAHETSASLSAWPRQNSGASQHRHRCRLHQGTGPGSLC